MDVEHDNDEETIATCGTPPLPLPACHTERATLSQVAEIGTGPHSAPRSQGDTKRGTVKRPWLITKGALCSLG
jgi:hypothetical protein